MELSAIFNPVCSERRARKQRCYDYQTCLDALSVNNLFACLLQSKARDHVCVSILVANFRVQKHSVFSNLKNEIRHGLC